MTQYNTLNVKFSNSQLDKLKSAKTKTNYHKLIYKLRGFIKPFQIIAQLIKLNHIKEDIQNNFQVDFRTITKNWNENH